MKFITTKKLPNIKKITSKKRDIIAIPAEREVTIIIPTYKPNETTLKLIDLLADHNPDVQVIVVNDCIPENSAEHQVFEVIKGIAKQNKNITCLRTERNSHKSGALNLGIQDALSRQNPPQVIFTCDDDIIVNKHTIHLMLQKLFSKSNIGAVCSRSLVKNKHVNLLTRLQALEYFGFTVTKIADNNFLHGPLVMQGMLTGFRAEALKKVEGFTLNHLIEDYDITVRIKKMGWKVAIAKDAQAWTVVPETLKDLWKQRVRWCYWGIIVVKDNLRFLPAIFQDFLGHAVFLSLLILILISLIFYRAELSTNVLIQGIITLSFLQFFLSYLFGLITMAYYEDKDATDWTVRLSIIPELLYSNIMTLVLVGCYVYLFYNVFLRKLIKKVALLDKPYEMGLQGFARAGYVHHWGTRSPQQKELV